MVELNNPTVSDNTESGALNMVKLTIDNCEVMVPEHTTILDAAKSAGIQIPTLCYLRDLNEIGVAVAPRQLHEAEPIAMRIETARLGVEGDAAAPTPVIGKIALVQADGHGRPRAERPGAPRSRRP